MTKPAPHVESILSRLPDEDRRVILDEIDAARPKSVEELRTARDDAIRELRRRLYGDLPATVAALEIARTPDRYLASRWSAEADLATLGAAASEKGRLLHKIARANRGLSLSARQIANIFNGIRSGTRSKKNEERGVRSS